MELFFERVKKSFKFFLSSQFFFDNLPDFTMASVFVKLSSFYLWKLLIKNRLIEWIMGDG